MSFMTIDRPALIAHLKAATKKAKLPEPPKPPRKLDSKKPEDKKILGIIRKIKAWELCDDGREQAIEGVKYLTGFDISPYLPNDDEDDEGFNTPSGVVFVPTNNTNDHNYGKDPTIATGGDHGHIRRDGKEGNYMGSHLRKATDAEIEGLTKAQLVAYAQGHENGDY